MGRFEVEEAVIYGKERMLSNEISWNFRNRIETEKNMKTNNKSVNAGVHGSTGVEFQKHCALYFLFDRYKDLKDRKYFICLEHHDDFLFCYQTGDELISSIDSYQAKKSSSQWTLCQEMYVLIKKMTEVGLALYADSMPKADNYSHNLGFITNNSIKLNVGKSKNAKFHLINESNNRLKFIDLNKEISNKIKTEIEKLLGNNSVGLKELENISLGYIDLPKNSQAQKDTLVGQFYRIFGNKICDHRAAVETLLLLFRDVENTLNQGNTAKLMDISKRIDSNSINDAINLITTKKMAFELWRQEKKEICKRLNISVSERNSFELEFVNSFDRFKDLRQVEHLKILSFVQENNNFNLCTDEDCIQELYEKYRKNISSQLSELNIKAAIYAAFIEVRETL